MLGDCYCAAVVEVLSKDDLEKMDKEREEEETKDKVAMDIESAKAFLKANWSQVTKVHARISYT